MKVLFFAYIRDYTNTKEITVEYCSTLKDLLLKLCEIYGPKFERLIFKGDIISDEIIILINGRNIVHLSGIDTLLCPENEISIFPVVAGG